MQNEHEQRKQPAKPAGQKLSPERRELIRKAAKKIVEDYGETLRMLGKE